MTGSDLTAATGWLADTHAHLYSCFPIQQYFESAIRNIDRVHGPGGGTGCLLVAETATDRSFSRLVESAPRTLPGGFTLHATSEPTSFVVAAEAGTRLALIGGRQIVTAEGLEVLVFGGAADDAADGRAADAA